MRGLIFEHGDAALASLEPAMVKPPEAARDVLRMQLSSLAPETRTLLSQASVLGESFELSLLGRVSGHDADALLAELEVASKRGFVWPRRRIAIASRTRCCARCCTRTRQPRSACAAPARGRAARPEQSAGGALRRDRAALLSLATGRRLRRGHGRSAPRGVGGGRAVRARRRVAPVRVGARGAGARSGGQAARTFRSSARLRQRAAQFRPRRCRRAPRSRACSSSRASTATSTSCCAARARCARPTR